MTTVHRTPLLVAAIALVLALAFLGSRPLWEPDEGRYTNVAMGMLDRGDWVEPVRSHHVGHWTKPPLTYWTIAAGASLFGRNTWAVRLPMALAYLLCVGLVARCARRLAPGAEALAALVFATMLLPFAASQVVTADVVVTALQALAVCAFVEARFGEAASPRPWMLLSGAAFAGAFLAKGPPALLPLLAIVALRLLAPSPRPGRALPAAGVTVFAMLALPWYMVVIHAHPGLLGYLVGSEVVGRVAGQGTQRHGEWYGWLTIYGPTLLLGTLPWTADVLRWARGLPASLRRWCGAGSRRERAPELMLALWVLLPLLVFCVARSRMPLYLLPLCVPLSLVVARQRQAQGRGLPRAPALALWVVALLALKAGVAHWPTHKDASAWAEAIQQRAGAPVAEVVFLEDMARYGVHLYLGAEVEKVALAPVSQPRYNPVYDDTLVAELAEGERAVVWVTKEALWPEVKARVGALGFRAHRLGGTFEGRVIFRVLPQSSRLPPKAGVPASDTRNDQTSSTSRPPRAASA